MGRGRFRCGSAVSSPPLLSGFEMLSGLCAVVFTFGENIFHKWHVLLLTRLFNGVLQSTYDQSNPMGNKDMASNIMNLVNSQNGTYYGDNSRRCSVLDEAGNQFLVAKNFGLASEEVMPILADDGHGNFVFQSFSLDGVSTPIVNSATGVQASLYRADGTLKTLVSGLTIVDPATLLPINNTLTVADRGKVIHWNCMSAEAVVPLAGVSGFEKPVNAVGVTITNDYKSSRGKEKAEGKVFTFTFNLRGQMTTGIQALRLLSMNPDGSLSYINDTGANYSRSAELITGYNGDVHSLYGGNAAYQLVNNKNLSTHSVTVTYPTTVIVSAFEIAVSDQNHGPTNVTLTFTGVDGKEKQAARVTGFVAAPASGETCVLRLPLHDAYTDVIDIGPDYTVYNEQMDIKAKITARQPLTMTEFMTLWLPRSEAIELVNGIALGKTAKDISTVNKAITTRYYNMAVGASLVA